MLTMCATTDGYGDAEFSESLDSVFMGVIAPFPHFYAASCPFCKLLAVSRGTIGIALDAKYR